MRLRTKEEEFTTNRHKHARKLAYANIVRVVRGRKSFYSSKLCVYAQEFQNFN